MGLKTIIQLIIVIILGSQALELFKRVRVRVSRLGVRRRGVRRRAVRRSSCERAQACHNKSFFTTFSRQIPMHMTLRYTLLFSCSNSMYIYSIFNPESRNNINCFILMQLLWAGPVLWIQRTCVGRKRWRRNIGELFCRNIRAKPCASRELWGFQGFCTNGVYP
jgi:hypothetical protein